MDTGNQNNDWNKKVSPAFRWDWSLISRFWGDKRNSAFTLIELLLVVSVIAIVGIASISWFSRMTEVQDAETTVKVIGNTLELLDRDVARHKAISYKAVFESGSLGFLIDIDRYQKTTPVEYGFDFATGTGFAKSTNTGTGVWELRFSTDNTSGETFTLPANGGVQTFSFPVGIQKRKYVISSAIGERILNSYIVQYYSLNNVKSTQENEVRLVGIFGWNNTSYTSLTVENVLGKRVLLGSGNMTDTLEKATLLFEKNGREMDMIIVP